MKLKEVIEKNTKGSFVKAGIKNIYKNPEKNIAKLFEYAKGAIKVEEDKLNLIKSIEEAYNNNENIKNLIKDIIETTDKKCFEKLAVNFLAYSVWFGREKREKLFKKTGVKTPFVLLVNSSSRDNLKGAYALGKSKSEYFKSLDKTIDEGREKGVYFFIVLGEEEALSKLMLEIYNKYDDCIFLTFIKGSIINESTGTKVKNLGNVIPMVSLEGFEEETDKKKGKGEFKKTLEGMEFMRKKGILFGVSTAINRYNLNTVISEEFIDMLIKKGSKVSCYFDSMAYEKSKESELALTKEQCINLERRIKEIKDKKPCFVINLFNYKWKANWSEAVESCKRNSIFV